MSCFEEGAEPLVVDFHEHEPPGCQKKTLEIIIIIIVIERKEANHAGRYITKHLLTLTPAGAESDLNAAADGA